MKYNLIITTLVTLY